MKKTKLKFSRPQKGKVRKAVPVTVQAAPGHRWGLLPGGVKVVAPDKTQGNNAEHLRQSLSTMVDSLLETVQGEDPYLANQRKVALSESRRELGLPSS